MKKIIISTGDKGGAGKSMSARFVGEMLMGLNIENLTLVDFDQSNPDLHDKFHGREGVLVLSVSLDQRESIDSILNSIFDAPDGSVFLFDMPAGASQNMMREFEVFSALMNLPDVQAEFIWTLNSDQSGVNQLKVVSEAFSGVKGRFTVVRNHFYGDDFALYESSDIRKKLKKERPDTVETDLPEIPMDVLKNIGSHPIETVNQNSEISFTDRVRIGAAYKEVKAGFAHLMPTNEVKIAEKKTEKSNA